MQLAGQLDVKSRHLVYAGFHLKVYVRKENKIYASTYCHTYAIQ